MNIDPASPPTPASRRAGNRAAAWLWHLLGEFASLGQIPKAWGDVSPDHPFLCGVGGEGGQPPRLAVNLPGRLTEEEGR